MKIYSLDENPNLKDITKNPLIATIEDTEISLDTVLNLDGVYYVPGWIVDDNIGVHEININPEKEVCGTPELVCPFCGYHHSVYYSDGSDSYVCDRCGAVFDVFAEKTVHYTTTLLKAPPIISVRKKETVISSETFKNLMNDETTMERLLKVINGLWAGTIKIMKSPCRKEPVAYIGNDYQYFLPEGDENLTPEQVMEKYDIVTLATMILKAIEGNDEEDYDYFCDQLGF